MDLIILTVYTYETLKYKEKTIVEGNKLCEH